MLSARNQFRHQLYPTEPVVTPKFVRLSAQPAEKPDHPQLHSRLQVNRVILIHGTFMGDDPFGISDVLDAVGESAAWAGRILKPMAAELRLRSKKLAAGLAKDVGNYSQEFRELFSQLVGGDPVIELPQTTWSGQNHHLARADLAVRLIDMLLGEHRNPGGRTLLWGHSHAGNGFALLTNLLANDREFVAQFFAACGPQSAPHWLRVRQSLAQAPSPHPLADSIYIVTFGTPVRYGWDITGCRSLVHVLHHRTTRSDAADSEPPSVTSSITTQPLFPPHSLTQMINAEFGDWVQAFGIAGTDVSGPVSAAANRQLTEFLEASLPAPETSLDLRLIQSPRIRNLCARWKFGTRCHTQGQNLLVDYELSGRNSLGLPLENSLFGHGVATTTTWLPAHLQLVTESLQETEHARASV